MPNADPIRRGRWYNGSWNSRSVKRILTNCTSGGRLVQRKEKRAVKLPMYAGRFWRIWRSSKSGSGKELQCGFTGTVSRWYFEKQADMRGRSGKMQQKRGIGRADWRFCICTTKNRLDADMCTAMYVRREDVFSAIQVWTFASQIADLAQHKTMAWINAMEYVREEIFIWTIEGRAAYKSNKPSASGKDIPCSEIISCMISLW